MAETLVSRSRQRPRMSSTAPCGVGKTGGVRLGLAVNTLLGPEGTSTPAVLVGLFVSSGFQALIASKLALLGWVGGPVWGLVVV